MDLENALETAGRLRDALAVEVESARRERQLLRSLDAAALFARASQRGAFLADVARLERELAAHLGAAAKALGLEEITLDRLRLRVPAEGTRLAHTLAEVRALAGALQEVDRLNLDLAARALACVRGYVEAVRPTPRAYDRRGARAAAPALAMVSSKG
jgi:flagellar FlgN protein